MVIDVSELQPKNAIYPILVTLFGMLTDVRDWQPENAEALIIVTLLGMVNEPAFFPGQETKVLPSLVYRTPSTDL